VAPEQAGTKDSHDLQWGTNVELHPAKKPTADCAPPSTPALWLLDAIRTPLQAIPPDPPNQPSQKETRGADAGQTPLMHCSHRPPSPQSSTHFMIGRTRRKTPPSLSCNRLYPVPTPRSPIFRPRPRRETHLAMPCHAGLTSQQLLAPGRQVATLLHALSPPFLPKHRRRVTHHRSAGSGALPPPQT